jgi:hypothetical protein
MARTYKIIEKKNPHYEEMKEKLKDKPELIEELSQNLYGLAEVYFSLEEAENLTDEMIIERADSYTQNLLSRWYGSPERLIEDLEMMVKDIVKRPLPLNIDKRED